MTALNLDDINWPSTLTLTRQNVAYGLFNSAGLKVFDNWPQDQTIFDDYRWEARSASGRAELGVLVRVTDDTEHRAVPPEFWLQDDDIITREIWEAATWGVNWSIASSQGADGAYYVTDWDSRPWNSPNPYLGDTTYSQEAAKPSWNEMRSHVLRWYVPGAAAHLFDRNGIDEILEGERDTVVRVGHAHTQAPAATVDIGNGLERLPALVHLASAATMASEVFPRAVMASDRGPVHLWTAGEATELIGDVARRRNTAESARNLLAERVRHAGEKLNDENGGRAEGATEEEKLNGRIEGLEAIDAVLSDESLGASFQGAMDEVADDSLLPHDLERVRNRLIEMLEARATGHQKRLKGALSQQAIDNWAACVDMDEALGRISRECVLASINIRRVDEEYRYWVKGAITWTLAANAPATWEHEGEDDPLPTLGAQGEHYRQDVGRPAAIAAYDAGVAAIKAVTAANTPIWHIASTPYDANPSTPVEIAASSVNVVAAHPTGPDIPGNVVITGPTASTPVTVSPLARPATLPDSAHACQIAITNPVQGETVTVFVTAQNLCGISEVEIRLTP